MEIGEELRRHREGQGFTLEQVEAATRIRARYLRALEEGEFHRLPGEAYVKGYLRAYATFLGLDADEVLESYRAGREAAAAPAEAGKEPVIPGAPVSRGQRKRRRQRRLGWVAGLAAGALLVVAAALALRPAPSQPAPSSTSSGGSPPAEAAPSSPGAPESGAAPPAPPAATVERRQADRFTYEFSVRGGDALEVRAELVDVCWVSVRADGQLVEEGLLQPGSARTWTAREVLSVRAGRPGALRLTANGVPLEPLPGNEPLWLNFRRAP